MRITKKTIRLMWILAAVAAASLLWWLGAGGVGGGAAAPSGVPGGPGAPAAGAPRGAAALTPGPGAGSAATAAARNAAATAPRATDDDGAAAAVAEHPEVTRLQELLDENDAPAILAQARRLVRSTEAPLRSAAVNALRWIATRDAARELAALTGDADAEVADEAGDALMAVLDEVDDEALSATLLEQAIRSAAAPESGDAFCLRLAGLDEGQSIPVLVNLLESGNERLVALGKEYLEFVTGGEEISSRAEAEAWLREHAVNQDAAAEEAE
ncbi:MAG: hypothetical protein GX595_20385 [Lentisphaerae bacterium]|nr:hypothetical protein [Lentisphaerota bacterium]